MLIERCLVHALILLDPRPGVKGRRQLAVRAICPAAMHQIPVLRRAPVRRRQRRPLRPRQVAMRFQPVAAVSVLILHHHLMRVHQNGSPGRMLLALTFQRPLYSSQRPCISSIAPMPVSPDIM